MNRSRIQTALLVAAVTGLVAGLVLAAAGRPVAADWAWTAGVLPGLAALAVEIARSLRRGEVGLDIVAALSMTAALAFGETLAAAVVALMYAGGSFLEAYAEGRARAEMKGLLSRVPRRAARLVDGRIEDVAVEALVPGDRLLIRQGDVIPADGSLAATALLDLSALTGESLPLRHARGDEVPSGATNAGEPFEMIAARPAADSTYAGIVRLVEAAQASKAPMSRLADRWSLGFLAVTLAIAGLAWGLSGDPIRAVAVLVVATPCPLILAVPVALVSGLSRAAKLGVLVKGAAPLEAMARVRALVLDKTGTLTDGRPSLVAVEPAPGFGADEVLRLGAALDQASKHPVALALVAAAHKRGLDLPLPADVVEVAGDGLTGMVGGRSVAVGGEGFVARLTGSPRGAGATEGQVTVAVAVDGAPAGRIVMADALRPDAKAMVATLRAGGIDRILLATGDRKAVAQRVTAGLGFDAVESDLTPEDKVRVVQAARAHGPVMMVGDGVNDAPALAAADVGVAMGARGAAASAEAADVVLLVDRVDRLADGVAIARRARRIAVESVVAGIGLSVAGMIAAAFGLLSPVQGAILQEAIDVAVILNALRALR